MSVGIFLVLLGLLSLPDLAPPWVTLLVIPPALLWAPGVGWARFLALHRNRATPGDALMTHLDAVWISVFVQVLSVVAIHAAVLPPPVLPALSGAALIGGIAAHQAARRFRAPRDREAATGPTHVPLRLGIVAVFGAVLAAAWVHRDAALRPLDAFWWDVRAEVPDWPPARISAEGFVAWGDPEAGVLRTATPLPDGDATVPLQVQGAGRLLAVVRSPVGCRLRLEQAGNLLDAAHLAPDPIVDPEEGPVPRYLRRGAGVVAAPLAVGEATLLVRCPPPPATGAAMEVWLLPTQDAVWSASAAIPYVHYYQILNQVENQRWAAEVLTSRWATVSQPPLWSWVLAAPAALDGLVAGAGDLPGAFFLLAWVAVLAGLSALRLLLLLAPDAPRAAWFLPGLGAAMHLRLMVEPGSMNFPDSLYAAALLAGVGCLVARPGPFPAFTLAAGLLRYPGAPLLLGAAAVHAVSMRGSPQALRPLARAGVAVGLVATLVLVAWHLGGGLGAGLETVSFEILPEHWHGDFRPDVLVGRIPGFLATWMLYTGGAGLVALGAYRGASRSVLAVLLASVALLCTIDHSPSHYFVPLQYLSAVLAGVTTSRVRGGSLLAWLLVATAAWAITTLPIR